MKLSKTKTAFFTALMLYGRLTNAAIFCQNSLENGGSDILVIHNQEAIFSTPEGQNTFKTKMIPGHFDTDLYQLHNENGLIVGDITVVKKPVISRSGTNLGDQISAKLKIQDKEYFFFGCDETVL